MFRRVVLDCTKGGVEGLGGKVGKVGDRGGHEGALIGWSAGQSLEDLQKQGMFKNGNHYNGG